MRRLGMVLGIASLAMLLTPLGSARADGEGTRDIRWSKYHPLQADLWIAALPGVNSVNDPGQGRVIVRNAVGRVVRTDHVNLVCRFDLCDQPGEEPGYTWVWDGKVDGIRQPPGRYQVAARTPDADGHMVKRALGSVWIQHLVTRTARHRFGPAGYVRPERSAVGRCSKVVSPGPYGWKNSLGLLSNVRCRSTAGDADRVFQSLWLPHATPGVVETMVKQRWDVYGAAVKAGSTARLMRRVDSADGWTWRRLGPIGPGAGWHNGAFSPGASAWVQLRVDSGDRYDVKYLRSTIVYRAWVR